jgi:signal transduction histidine kinase
VVMTLTVVVGAVLSLHALGAGQRSLEAAERARLKAEQVDTLKTRWIATLTHEVRTPLSTILGYVELMRDGVLSPPELAEGIRCMEAAGEELATLLRNVTEIALAQNGERASESDEVDLRSILEEIVLRHRLLAQSKGVAFNFEDDGSLPPTVWVDARRIGRIVDALLDNACRHTHAGSICMRVSAQHGDTSIEVEDTGVPLDASGVDRVFQPFAFGDRSLAGERRVASQGLAVASLWTETIGGRLTFDSDKRDGARVTLLVPSSRAGRRAGGTPAGSSQWPDEPCADGYMARAACVGFHPGAIHLSK